MAVPPFFHAESAEAFHMLETEPTDVVLSSLVKGGTTWCHTLLWSLLHRFDETGSSIEGGVGGMGQVYPDALPLVRPTQPPIDPAEAFRRNVFGDGCFDDLCRQKPPRLFSTHLAGEMLPARLVAPDGHGRLIIMLRNLKDVLVSTHFFRGEPKDGWLGNEHGAGSLSRFLDVHCPNAYGSCFDWVKVMDRIHRTLKPTGRVHVIYFEHLKLEPQAEISKLADFLGIHLTAQKLNAVVGSISFDAMRRGSRDVASHGAEGAAGVPSILLRKGQIGDWRNHMGDAEWRRFDEVFQERLGNVELAQPMLPFQ